jgi:predicted O-methyltransferase YrrM
MSTLTTAPLAPLLEQLLKEDAASDTTFAGFPFSEEEMARMMQSKTEYRKLYGGLKDFPLAISRETGMLLYMLVRSSGMRNIVEFGTSTGVSTLFLAAALRDNGGGRLITSEFEASKVAKAKENLQAGGLVDLVEIREGDALQTLGVDLPDAIDLLLLDGSKALYLEILALTEKHLRPGALILADDAEFSPDYLARVRSSSEGYLSVRIADGVELSMRLG